MTEAEVKRLIESAVAPYRDRALQADAMIEANRVLAPLALREGAKQMIVENVLRGSIPATGTNTLDIAKFTELVTAEAKRVAAAMGESAAVMGLGASASGSNQATDAGTLEARLKERKLQRKLEKEASRDFRDVFESIGMPKAAAKYAAEGRAA